MAYGVTYNLMQTKLTLRLDSDLIAMAKRQADGRGRSLSQMVADYFRSLSRPNHIKSRPLTPIVSAMHGILKGTKVRGKDDWYRYLEKKYL
jgi:hypothetical protein